MKKHFNLLGATLLFPSLLLANNENTHSLAVSIFQTENQSVFQTVEKKITGVVYDEAGIPVIGANILEKGTTNGTITDIDGNFSLTVSDKAVLVVSYIGYDQQEIVVQGKDSFVINLKEDSQTLEEVVVVGYGVQKKKLVTGATVQVKGEDLQKLNTVNPMGALQSQSPGVNITKTSGQPGSEFKVSVRGIGTVGDSSPLYIVDGVTVSNIDYLSPSDIESIDVLKDAASAAIYGARAANGVILVTTKQGKSGKAVIEYDGYVGWQNIVQNVTPLNAQQYAMIMSEAAENSEMNPFDFQNLVPDWDKIESGEWTGTNWFSEMCNKNAFMQNHALNVRGGTDMSVYSLGLSYTTQEGSFGNPAPPQYTRYSFRLNTDHKLIKGNGYDVLKIGENLNYTYSEKSTIGTGNLYVSDLRQAFITNPFLPVYDENGDYHYAIDWNEKQINPMGFLYYEHSQNLRKNNRLSGNIYVELQPLKGLKFRSSFGLHLDMSSYRKFVPTYNLGPEKFCNENVTTQQFSLNNKWLFENTLSYDLTIKENHAFNFLVGTSAEKSGLGENINGENVNSVFNDFKHAYLDNNRQIYEGKTKLSGGPQTPGRLLSYFGRVNYNFRETYMATLVMRADGSSNFAPKNRWGFFPSISAGWVITNEKFMQKTSSWLEFLKIRASWGQNGNQNIAGFQYLANIAFDSMYFFGDNKNNVYTGAYPSILANTDIKWETSEQIDLGIDARFLSGRLGLTFDWYDKKTKDWLLVAPILGSYGTGAPYINGGDVLNRGVEFGLSWRDQINEFHYSINGNIAYNKNEVTRIANSEGIIHGPANVLSHNTAELYRAQVGYPIGYFWGYETDGIFQNDDEVMNYKNAEGKVIMPDAKPGDLRFVDKNGDGTIDDNDKGMIGDPNPDITFGLSANMSYKGFDLSIVTSGVAGNQIARSYRSGNEAFHNYTTEILDRWHGEGTSNTVPRVTASASINDLYISDRYIENGSYWRISNITIGYDFKKLFKNLPLQQARLYVTGQNLATLTAYKGLDPEVGYGYDSSWASGIDLGFYPSPRTFMVGVSLKY
ncbi:TonB-dependent receptor [Bacteroides sp.]|uniref:SusC/RagA family TonB-linked outer membrane protein n=1 Tax=Bacteroides sp. TaxID=29523 RepID=UPI0025836E2F|nr:TonB-dependent receptor [Bacteroides sp.]